MTPGKKIKLGIFGAWRGSSYAAAANTVGAEVVAVCDVLRPKAEALAAQFSPEAAIFTDFDEFLKFDMDAVVLCNFFSEHAPYAIKALESGRHVLSECVCNITVAEGVALCRAAEKAGKIYKLAENYPYSASNMEMKRIYDGGTLGRVMYAEGEYVHPMSTHERNYLNPGESHWRNWMPTTYYITHSLAPLMYITGAMPVSVNALAVEAPELFKGTAVRSSDGVGIILCRMDNGAVFRVTGCAGFAGHGNWYRISCTKGAVESVRGNQGDVRLVYNSWDKPEGAEESKTYTAQWPHSGELAEKAGHGGGDFWVMYNFVQSIHTGRQPFFDVYRGVAASTVGLMAWESVLKGGASVELPNFKDEQSRKKYENHHYTANPFATDVPEQFRLPCAQNADYRPSEADYENAYKTWDELGYNIKRMV